ncbi:MAG: fasciclin domain-containing protein [Candidatus Pacebacteria bacterium]|nr:fasciclin domain-containing protein [Candidatus Paceibacterota bacterium]
MGLVLLIAVGGILLFNNNNQSAMEEGDQNMSDTMVNEEMQENNNQVEDMDQMGMDDEANTIVDIAVSNPNFSTLVTALQKADLVEVLAGEGPFTVFAPTNEAFAKIPEETLNEILADKEQLTQILTYHVVAGKVMAEDVVSLTSATTVQGGDLAIEVMGNSVMVNNANVIQTDIEASNGVIHVIDTVLIPHSN